MGLIYANPQGPNGNRNPIAAAQDIRETFARMAMNDEETVALIALGATRSARRTAPSARSTSTAARGRRSRGPGIRLEVVCMPNALTPGPGGLEGTWTATPIKWDNSFFDNLFNYERQADQEPRRRKRSLHCEGRVRSGHRSRCPRPVPGVTLR